MHLLRLIYILYCAFLILILLINLSVFWNSDFSILFATEKLKFQTWKLELYTERNITNSNSSTSNYDYSEMKGAPIRVVVKSVLKKGSVVDKFLAEIVEERKSWNVTKANMAENQPNKCLLPNLQPWDFNKPYGSAGIKHNCKSSQGDFLFYTDRESNLITYSNRKDCCYESLINPGTCHPITSKQTKIPAERTYALIKVQCKNSKSYSQKFAIVNKHLQKSSPAMDTTLNVVIIGLQSVSRMNFIREMPQTHNYLTENLDAISLEGYSKISDNSFDNLIAMHTGGHPNEKVFPNCDAYWSNDRIDGYPFLWEKFSLHGFYTSYSEDAFKKNMYLSHCNYNNLWEKQRIFPTDYFIVNLSKEMEKDNKSDPICFDKQFSFAIFLDHIEKMATTFRKDRYFQFTWQQMVSGEDKSSLELADPVMLKTLKFLDIKGHLSNTVLILLSDQGIKKGKFRDTEQGQLENRNPVAYFVLPPFFSKKFPLAMKNLRDNAKKLVSPFDIHETVKEFMNLTRLKDNVLEQRGKSNENTYRGVSLFVNMSEYRNCSDAGIPMHYCLCSPRTPFFADTSFAMDASYFMLREMNSMLNSTTFNITTNSSQCQELKGQAIVTALEFTLSDKTSITTYEYVDKQAQKITKAADSQGVGLQITLRTRPCDVIYEATMVKLLDGDWFVSGSISITSDISKMPDVNNCTHIPEEVRGYCCCKPN